MASMNLVQLIAASVEAQLFDKIHALLGQIAEDYELSHGELVDRYLKYENVVDAPKVIYKATEEVVPEERPKRQVKVTKKKAESDEQAEGERKGKCEGVTAKGLACKNKAQPGSCFCHLHKKKEAKEGSDSEETRKVPRPRKTAAKKEKEVKTPDAPKKRGRKAKKVEPVHMHSLDEAAEECELCESHGNASQGEQEFEIDEATLKREALRCMLAEELGQEEGDITDEMLEEFEAEVDKEEAASEGGREEGEVSEGEREEGEVSEGEREEGEVAGEEELD
jgi:hypothetical protein